LRKHILGEVVQVDAPQALGVEDREGIEDMGMLRKFHKQ